MIKTLSMEESTDLDPCFAREKIIFIFLIGFEKVAPEKVTAVNGDWH